MNSRQAKKVLRNHMDFMRYLDGFYYRDRTVASACRVHRRLINRLEKRNRNTCN